MLEGITLYSTSYYEKNVFKGSYRGVNFYLQKIEEEDKKMLEVTLWKGPFILEKTTEEKIKKQFAFSEEGIDEAGDWIAEQQNILCGN